MPVECVAALAGSVEHGPRQVPGVGRRGFLREALEGRAPGVRHEERDRLGVAVDGWHDDEGSFRGKKTGPNPTDRAKSGTKRSLLVEGKGVPIGVTVSGANTHDKRLVEKTLESMPIGRPEPTEESPQNICLDRGYDFPDVRELVDQWGYTAHIPRRGEDQSKRQKIPGYRARRWVVERTHSWMNRFRRLLIRWEKKVENYLAMVQFACAWITYQQSGLFA